MTHTDADAAAQSALNHFLSSANGVPASGGVELATLTRLTWYQSPACSCSLSTRPEWRPQSQCWPAAWGRGCPGCRAFSCSSGCLRGSGNSSTRGVRWSPPDQRTGGRGSGCPAHPASAALSWPSAGQTRQVKGHRCHRTHSACPRPRSHYRTKATRTEPPVWANGRYKGQYLLWQDREMCSLSQGWKEKILIVVFGFFPQWCGVLSANARPMTTSSKSYTLVTHQI